MSNPFEKVDDWPAEAKLGGYRVRQVAMHLGISVRWLEMYLKKRFGKRPHQLFAKWREREIRLAAGGKTGKEMLDEVRLAHCSSLSRSLLRDGKSGLRELKRDREVLGVERKIAGKPAGERIGEDHETHESRRQGGSQSRTSRLARRAAGKRERGRGTARQAIAATISD